MSSSATALNGVKNRKSKGVDTLLTIRGRPLQTGESVRFSLIKGPAVESSGDPVDSKAPAEHFPLIAKFGESVVRPDFTGEPWKSARLYQQEIPKPVDDSDEEGEDGPANQPKKKRWRYAGDAVVPRQWILQENVDFLQTMVDRKEQASDPSHAGSDTKNQLSSRYEGIAEHNTSHYAMVRLHPSTTSPNDARLEVCLLPSVPQNCMINFAQPASRKTYSLTEAEHVITDQRMGLVKTLHHMHPTGGGGAGGDTDPSKKDSADPEPAAAPRNILALRKKAAQSSKGRLLNKLVTKAKLNTGEEEDGDDVMGDVAFRNRKGGGVGRKELLQTVAGDGGPTVSNEGVLGGSNDAMFGGRQRFAQLSGMEEDVNAKPAEKEAGAEEEDGGREASVPAERGGDGAAMEDDFYQRDVKAEYDELDYDPNEQFDDDDVDLGEAEVVVESTGFGGDDEEDDEEDEDVDMEDDVKGAEGLASLAGFKALLAKARGETPPEPSPEAAALANQKNPNNSNDGNKQKVDHMTKIMAAAEQSRLAAERRKTKQGGGAVSTATNSTSAEPMDTTSTSTAPAAAAAPQAPTSEAPLVDANGFRIISLEAVRREIWLNHGAIPMKRLMKIFDVKKKSAKDRQDKFRDILKELCIMKSDPINGRMLVLKQHYSKG